MAAARRPRRAQGLAGSWAALALLLAAAAGTAPAPVAAQIGRDEAAGPRLLVVNRAAVVANSAAARALSETERRIRDRVQAENDRVRAALEAEERELTELRDELAHEAFERRTREFDRRVRAERRKAQERGALLLRFVQDARAALASALPRVLEGLRREAGAALILDAEAVVAADPTLDVTDRAIARFDAEMGGVRFDPPAALLPDGSEAE